MRLLLYSLIILSLMLSTTRKTYAIVDPLSVLNNKFGIHVVDENDLENAAALVNSSGGDWGYVTIVIPENERNVEKWQKIFARMAKLHLIPIVRIATTVEAPVWKKPSLTDATPWADFLAQLKWVVKNRYVILFNEPNHTKEWGGIIEPEYYAEIIASFSSELKRRSDDFFVLAAGLDASAPNGLETMDEEVFLRRMHRHDSKVFEYIDGWTSHSYPNPGFTGGVYKRGRGSLTTYKWEVGFLEFLGNTKHLPIFITESGWPHSEGIGVSGDYFDADQVSDMIEYASENIWSDGSIVAVTPFILNYQSDPFSNFSWQKPNSEYFYPQFDAYRSIPKIAGQPRLEPTSTTVIPTQSQVLGMRIELNSLIKNDILNLVLKFFQNLRFENLVKTLK